MKPIPRKSSATKVFCRATLLCLATLTVSQSAHAITPGAVVSWEYGTQGQTIVPAAASSNVIAVATGTEHSLALKTDGSVVAWGRNFEGQTNVPVAAMSGVIAIAAGGYHSLALKSNGSVVAWGYDNFGQTDVPVAAQSGVIAIAGGGYFSMALKSNGSIVIWGSDSLSVHTIPVAAQSGVTAIDASGLFCMALKSDGSVVVWGDNTYGEMNLPTAVSSGVKAIAAGANHCVALKTDGTVVAWGDGTRGQTAIPTAAQTGAVAISASNFHSAIIKNDGTVIAWGENDYGSSISSTPILSDVAAIAVGYRNNLAIIPPVPPVNQSVTPNGVLSSANEAKSLAAVYSDSNGATDIGEAWIDIDSAVNGSNTIYAYYASATNRIYLRDDTNTNWLGGYAPGSSHTISNSQGTLDCLTTTVTRAGNLLKVNWNLARKSTYLGVKNIYLGCRDVSSHFGGWDDKGDWLVKGSSNVAPTLVEVTPNSLSSNANVPEIFTATYSDADSALDIREAYLVVNTTPSPSNCLYCYFDAVRNLLYMQDNRGVWLGGYSLGSAHTIANSQGTLNCATTTVSRSGNKLTVNWNLTPTTAITGTKNLFLFARDTASTSAGFTDLGDWIINGSANLRSNNTATKPSGAAS